jgi:hypothetical protein
MIMHILEGYIPLKALMSNRINITNEQEDSWKAALSDGIESILISRNAAIIAAHAKESYDIMGAALLSLMLLSGSSSNNLQEDVAPNVRPAGNIASLFINENKKKKLIDRTVFPQVNASPEIKAPISNQHIIHSDELAQSTEPGKNEQEVRSEQDIVDGFLASLCGKLTSEQVNMIKGPIMRDMAIWAKKQNAPFLKSISNKIDFPEA